MIINDVFTEKHRFSLLLFSNRCVLRTFGSTSLREFFYNLPHLCVNLTFLSSLFIFLFSLFFFLFSCSGNTARSVSYEFTNVRRGTLERVVSASGTIHPVATVNILPQMSGKVERVYVDYNDPVKAGDLLAELNTDVLRLRRDQQASTVRKARANYELQLVNFRNQQALAERDLISEFELRSSRTTLENLAADLAVAETNLRVIETEINHYAFITSPIDGIVLDRRVNAGDTVTDSSSNNSSAMFTLAENLREMRIEAVVGELDIAFIYRGQSVRFTLESLPGRRFTGTVENIRMVPTIANNVVTYIVIIGVENRDGSLYPGMTCAVDFVVERSEDALSVQNAALRFQPSTLTREQIDEMVFFAGLELMDDEEREAALAAREQTQTAAGNTGNQNALVRVLTGVPSAPASARQRPPSGQGRREQVTLRNLWFIGDDGRLQVKRVQIGINNGTLTELITTEDLEDMQVILRERR